MASGTSKKAELKLTNVARASLEELMRDYEDFIRQRGLRLWDKDSPEALAVRNRYRSEKSDTSDQSDQSDWSDLRAATPEAAANTILCLINQASYLLHRQIERLEQDLLDHGGFTERMHAARTQARQQQTHSSDKSDQSDGSDQSDVACTPPACPRCGQSMRLRTARQGPQAGRPFWGCCAYPDCRGTRPLRPSDESDRSDKSDVPNEGLP